MYFSTTPRGLALLKGEDKLYLWIDIETTGLDANREIILEVAWFLTDENLLKLTEGKTSFVYHELSTVVERLAQNPEAMKIHGDSGLYENYILALQGEGVVKRIEDIEEEILDDLDSVWSERLELVTVAGASVHFDKDFLSVAMPRLSKLFYHRNLDISSIRLMMQSCGVNSVSERTGRVKHRALDDIENTYDMAVDYYRFTREGILEFLSKSEPPKEEN